MEPRYWWLSRCKGNNVVLIFYFTKPVGIYIISEQLHVQETEKMHHRMRVFIYLFLKSYHLKKIPDCSNSLRIFFVKFKRNEMTKLQRGILRKAKVLLN